MRAELRRDLTLAMRRRDDVAVSALRSALSAIANAEAVPPAGAAAPGSARSPVAGAIIGLGAGDVARRELTDADVERIVRREIAERLTAAEEYARLGRPERAERLRAEAEVLGRYLA